jgi:glycine dehydrogenase subunit 1
MPFIPHTAKDVIEMLAAIGVSSIQELFKEIPADLQKITINGLSPPLTEAELSRLMHERAHQDNHFQCFIGGGAYDHHIPAAVWELTSRGEFMTAYTPYQAEASQGTLQLLYEYQTMMANLMALDVSNASLYDGASALAEAILMAVRYAKKSHTHRILLPRTVHPYYRQVVKTIAGQQNIEFIEIDFCHKIGRTLIESLNNITDENLTALIIPQPNFFGILEDVDALTDWIHKKNGLAIALVNPLSTALLKAPGQWGQSGADIACGEGQPLGVPLASGGPYYGFLCCKKDFVRQMPGRIVGRTVDQEGKLGFVLTLQAREQHIRRAKATSNICTNQGLLVTASTIYMSLLGPVGLRQVALASHENARLLQTNLTKIPGIKFVFEGFFFHELALRLPQSVDEVLLKMAKHKIQAGISLRKFYPELGEVLLVCVTETKTPEDIQHFTEKLAEAVNLSAKEASHVSTHF